MSQLTMLYPNLISKTLLIVAENFGLNFSGGSSATAMVTEHFEQIFREIIILCVRKGKHNLKRANFVFYKDIANLPSIIESYSNEDTIALGDFHFAHALAGQNVPYFFVYHDNWPELSKFDLFTEKEGEETIGKYGDIFSNAVEVFSVTEYKVPFISKFTDRTTVVRNGLSQAVTKKAQKVLDVGMLKVLMAGNIDSRKYAKAILLFEELKKIDSGGISVHIYGLVKEEYLERQLDEFDFVEVKGFVDSLRYDDYDVYLNTSLVENLSLSVVDALANHTPVFSFDVGGIKEVLNEDNGALIEDFDITAMASKLVDFKNGKVEFQFDKTNLADFDWQKSASKMLIIMNERIG